MTNFSSKIGSWWQRVGPALQACRRRPDLELAFSQAFSIICGALASITRTLDLGMGGRGTGSAARR